MNARQIWAKASPAPPGSEPTSPPLHPTSSLKGVHSPGLRLVGRGDSAGTGWGQGLTSDLWHAPPLTQAGLRGLSPETSDITHLGVGVGQAKGQGPSWAPHSPVLTSPTTLQPPRATLTHPSSPSTLRASQACPTASQGEGMSRKTASATWLTPKPLRHTSWFSTVTQRPTRQRRTNFDSFTYHVKSSIASNVGPVHFLYWTHFSVLKVKTFEHLTMKTYQ